MTSESDTPDTYDLPPEIQAQVDEGRQHSERRVPYRLRGTDNPDSAPLKAWRAWYAGPHDVYYLDRDAFMGGYAAGLVAAAGAPAESIAGLVRDIMAEDGEPSEEDRAWADSVLSGGGAEPAPAPDGTPDDFPLRRQAGMFDALRPSMLREWGWEGKWVLLQCNEAETCLEVFRFDSEQEAIAGGFDRYGYAPFLVKQVTEKDEPVMFMPAALPGEETWRSARGALAGVWDGTPAEEMIRKIRDGGQMSESIRDMLAREAAEAEDRAEAEERGEVEPAPGQRAADSSPSVRDKPDSFAAAAVDALLDLAASDTMEAQALAGLSMALRSGLTPEEQRKVAMDLLGEPHVSMLCYSVKARPSPSKILVTARVAGELAGRGVTLLADTTDPWWQKQ